MIYIISILVYSAYLLASLHDYYTAPEIHLKRQSKSLCDSDLCRVMVGLHVRQYFQYGI